MKKEFLLSIVIPTKNRERYAKATIEQILNINDDRIQVVVQDNSDSCLLPGLLVKYNDDNRLKYVYKKGTISFVENFDLAISNADGEYLCIIGDDDGIVPQIVDVVLWAKNNNVDAIKPELNAIYFWPNSEALRNKVDDGYLSISRITTKAKICNPYYEVEKLLNQGAQRYLSLDLVKLYHGVVRRDCLEKIKDITGKYFGGLSPDIYISVALSLSVEKMIKLDFPLTISGICNKSGSSDSATGRHTGNLEDAPHFRGHGTYVWSENVPEFYSVDTIWADSALAAIKDLNRFDLLEKFNVEFLAINCIIKYPQFKGLILKFYKSYLREKGIYTIRRTGTFFTYGIKGLFKKIKVKFWPKQTENYYVNGIKNIMKADITLQKKLLEDGINTNMVISSLDELNQFRN
ncbi:glycosyltransferase family A protein [Neobacillus sp. YX16]|uniref:glycosyltransferase family 2 protein n=1 Tax=Neobacillus sp. YX16 TaxID=3047874 RepID=UPI0024C22461|nr:glycosyltransferase family A protein [Neobacillus sp. YX16]WHZ02847.1 glycosyltransferase family A protein [Neobacillus sp. YX16]